MFAASGFVQNMLNRPTSKERLLAAALNLECCKMMKERYKKHPFDYLDLSERVPELEYLEASNKIYKCILKHCNHKHLIDFQKCYLSDSADSLKYFRKYFKILKQSFIQDLSAMPLDTFINVFNLMFQQKINDGALWRDFLYLTRETLGTLKNFINFMEPHVLEFMLENLKTVKDESNTYSYHHIQKMLPVNICRFPSPFKFLSILLRFGHERNFNKKYLLSSINAGWYMCFERSYHIDRQVFTMKYPLKRIHYILQMYAALNIGSPEERAHSLNVVKQHFRAIPDPFITSREIEDFSETFHPSIRTESVGSFSLKFKQEFGVNDSRPRSLRHLSRITIRSAINENGKLPEGIEELPLPPLMKDYLNLIR